MKHAFLLFNALRLPTPLTGFLLTLLLFSLCFGLVHLIRFLLRLRNPQPPPKAEEKPPSPQPPPEPVYYIVEKKKRRAAPRYGEPKEIRFK